MRNMYAHPNYVPRGVMKIIPFWEYRYPRTFIGVDVVGGLLAVVAGVVLFSFGHTLGAVGYTWGTVAFVGAALRLWVGYQLGQFVQS
jgi:hypothetical protein